MQKEKQERKDPRKDGGENEDKGEGGGVRLDGGARYLSCGPSPPNRRNFFFCSCGHAKADLGLVSSMESDYQLVRCGWSQPEQPPDFLLIHWRTALLGQSKREKKKKLN
jgi:hypothetical protein